MSGSWDREDGVEMKWTQAVKVSSAPRRWRDTIAGLDVACTCAGGLVRAALA